MYHCNRKHGMYVTKKEYSAYYNIKAKIQCRGCEKSYEIVPNSKKGKLEDVTSSTRII